MTLGMQYSCCFVSTNWKICLSTLAWAKFNPQLWPESQPQQFLYPDHSLVLSLKAWKIVHYTGQNLICFISKKKTVSCASYCCLFMLENKIMWNLGMSVQKKIFQGIHSLFWLFHRVKSKTGHSCFANPNIKKKCQCFIFKVFPIIA